MNITAPPETSVITASAWPNLLRAWQMYSPKSSSLTLAMVSRPFSTECTLQLTASDNDVIPSVSSLHCLSLDTSAAFYTIVLSRCLVCFTPQWEDTESACWPITDCTGYHKAHSHITTYINHPQLAHLSSGPLYLSAPENATLKPIPTNQQMKCLTTNALHQITWLNRDWEEHIEANLIWNSDLGRSPPRLLQTIYGGGVPRAWHVNDTRLPLRTVRTCLDIVMAGGAI